MPAPEVPRPDLVLTLLARARRGAPLLLTGPLGSGKTTLLSRVGEALEREGAWPLYLDLMGAASSPERFVTAALEALPAERFASRLSQALELRRLAAAGPAQGQAAVHALFELWAGLDESAGRPVVLLLDEVTEIRSLAYFRGLREVASSLAAALGRRRRGTLLASSLATRARRLFGFESLEARPLAVSELTPIVGAAAGEVARGSRGFPRYARVLIEDVIAGGSAAHALARELAPGGRIESACRHSYESLLLRSKGYGVSKALMFAVAQQEGQTLTELCRPFGRSPGATRDYLGWLLDVDVLRSARKRYSYADGVLRQWVRLYGRGRLPSERELEQAARELVGAGEEAGAAPASSTPRRRESLMEID